MVANVSNGSEVGATVERGHRVCAIQREVVSDCEVVPESLQRDGGGDVPLVPEHRDHLAEDAYAAVSGPLDQATDDVEESGPIRDPLHHELRQELGGVDGQIPAFGRGGCEIC